MEEVRNKSVRSILLHTLGFQTLPLLSEREKIGRESAAKHYTAGRTSV